MNGQDTESERSTGNNGRKSGRGIECPKHWKWNIGEQKNLHVVEEIAGEWYRS